MVFASIDRSNENITKSIINIFEGENSEAAENLVDAALNIIKTYFLKDEDNTIYKEPNFYGDISGFLKGEKIGKSEDYSPNLIELIHDENKDLKRGRKGEKPQIDVIVEVIKNALFPILE